MAQNPNRYLLKKNVIFLMSLWGLVMNGYSQPLLIIGNGNAKIKGGFSYDFLSSPLRKSFDYGEANAVINLPVNVSAPMHQLIEDKVEGSLALPNFTATAQQSFNTSIDISAPMFSGAAFFAVRENGSLNISGSLGNTNLNIDTTRNRDGSRILLKGGINLPLKFDMVWRSFTYGYSFSPTKNIILGFQIHKHLFNASTAGNLQTSLTGKIELQTPEASFVGNIPYDENQIFGEVKGEYSGEAWAPEIGIRYGPLSLVSRMGLEIEAKGFLNSQYSVPFFIDNETLLPKYTEPDSFLTAENIPRLMHAEAKGNEYRIKDNLHIRVPQSHTLAFDFIRDKVFLSYTKVFGKLEVFSLGDSTLIDSIYFDTGDYLNASLELDDVILLTTKFSWFHHNLGISTFDISYRDNHNLYSDVIGETFGIPPLMPIWNFGFILGNKGAFSLDFFVAPLPAVRTGYHYAF